MPGGRAGVSTQVGSTSVLQRKVGRLRGLMESQRFVGPIEGAKARDALLKGEMTMW